MIEIPEKFIVKNNGFYDIWSAYEELYFDHQENTRILWTGINSVNPMGLRILAISMDEDYVTEVQREMRIVLKKDVLYDEFRSGKITLLDILLRHDDISLAVVDDYLTSGEKVYYKLAIEDLDHQYWPGIRSFCPKSAQLHNKEE